jgi:AraC-like DNA-binding protein
LLPVRHIEFFDRDHFEQCYHRVKARSSISQFIDFFWEFKFDDLWKLHPKGFQDILFPDLGYTYMINMGTPFIMQLNDEKCKIMTDSFIPRFKNITCYHTPGNKIFGIKFKVSPVIFEKEIDFSEYKEYVFPLAYLMDRNIVDAAKKAPSFTERMKIITGYYEKIVKQHSGKLKKVSVVTSILQQCYENNNFDISVEEIAAKHDISPRTLQRYFEATASIKCKPALQLVRIRKAIYHFIDDRETFNFSDYGYYDSSHFYRHAKTFFHNHKNAHLSITSKTLLQLREERLSKKRTAINLV